MLNKIKSAFTNVMPHKCAICEEYISDAYRMDKWGQRIHASHDVQMCCSCQRFVLPSDQHLPFNRHICSHCIGKVVRKPEHVKWVYDRIQVIFHNKGLDLPENIPVDVVDAARIAQVAKDHTINPNRLGLTVSARTGGLFGIKMSHRVYMIDYQHKVIFGGTLAHELLHVWQNEHNITLPPKFCEGFCNLGTYLLYTSLNNEMTQVLIDGMMKNPDPIYGEGFREVKRIFEQEAGCNLPRTMEILKSRTR